MSVRIGSWILCLLLISWCRPTEAATAVYSGYCRPNSFVSSYISTTMDTFFTLVTGSCTASLICTVPVSTPADSALTYFRVGDDACVQKMNNMISSSASNTSTALQNFVNAINQQGDIIFNNAVITTASQDVCNDITTVAPPTSSPSLNLPILEIAGGVGGFVVLIIIIIICIAVRRHRVAEEQAYKAHAEKLLQQAEKNAAAAGGKGPDGTARVTVEADPEVRARLERFYRKYNPDNLSKVDDVLRTYRTQEAITKLFAMLVTKYGPEPETMTPATAPAVPASAPHAAPPPSQVVSGNQPPSRAAPAPSVETPPAAAATEASQDAVAEEEVSLP